MNIEKIKSEFERLSQIITSWSDNEPITAIERSLALDKLSKIYEMVRFADSKPAEATTTTPASAAPQAAADEALEQEETNEQGDVEVEFIFAEEQDVFEVEEPTEQEAEPAKSEQSIGEILAATVAASIATEPAIEPIVEPAPAPIEKPAEQPAPEPTPAPVATPAPQAEPKVAAPAEEPRQEVKAEPAPQPKAEPKAARPMNSLFGVEEPNRKPRTKHQRMMSIYNDAESRPEKVVDISKIFDMDIDAAEPAPQPKAEHKAAEPTPAPKPQSNTREIYEEKVEVVAASTANDVEPKTTLGDVIAQNTQTLADTIAAPTALGEEISHKSIKSLRQGIGLNDKFLMIRDLFDGDADAYNEAIDALDGFDDFDDCIIYIAENFAWNADSEGAKFIMQLLERKLS